MTTYLYSNLSDGDSLAFDPFVDVLSFDLITVSAASVQLTQSDFGLVLNADNKSITLLNVSLAQLSATHITFADGSKLLVGDDSPSFSFDDSANFLYGGPGNDQLIGLGGNDYLDGGLGADILLGGTGNDSYTVDNPLDLIVEFADEGTADRASSWLDYVLPSNVEQLTLSGFANINGTGNELANVIVGNSGINILAGGAGDDMLDGSGGNDTLLGGPGDDTLVGGSGMDLLQGNEGNDLHVGSNEGDIAGFS